MASVSLWPNDADQTSACSIITRFPRPSDPAALWFAKPRRSWASRIIDVSQRGSSRHSFPALVSNHSQLAAIKRRGVFEHGQKLARCNLGLATRKGEFGGRHCRGIRGPAKAGGATGRVLIGHGASTVNENKPEVAACQSFMPSCAIEGSG